MWPSPVLLLLLLLMPALVHAEGETEKLKKLEASIEASQQKTKALSGALTKEHSQLADLQEQSRVIAAQMQQAEQRLNKHEKSLATVRGDVHEIRIGADTNVQDGAVIHCSYEKFGTYIGARVTVGHLALLHGCTVEDDAFIGMKACVMDGAVVEKGGWVAAGALVTPGKRVKSGELWAGSPAKFFRAVTADEREGAETAMRRYVGLGREYKAQ